MRCIAGAVFFIVFYFVALEIVENLFGTDAKYRYHPITMAFVGLTVIFFCCLPSILLRRSRRNEWRRIHEFEQDGKLN